MNNKLLKWITVFLFLVLTGMGFMTRPCYAASAVVELTSDSSSVTLGDDIFVYLKINSTTSFGDFEANISYDENILQYKKGPSTVTGGNGFLKVSDMGVSEGANTRKYTLKFRALKKGTCKISFSGSATVYEFESGNEMSVSANVLNVTVVPKKTASGNANLKELKISPSKLTPAFDKSIHEYSTQVDYETQQLIVNAIAENENATVSISGNDSLKVGQNKVIVSVLSESGAIIEYTINVKREDKANLVTPLVSPTPEAGSEETFETVIIDGEIYAVFSGKYKLIIPDDDIQIPKGYIATTINLNGNEVTAYAPQNDPAAEVLLLFAENESGEKSFYYFDRVEKTMLRYSNETLNTSDDTASNEENVKAEQYRNRLNIAIVTIIVLTGIIILLTIVAIRFYLKQKD